MDEIWDAVDKACAWRSPYMSFMGLSANLTGRGGWNATVWPGLNILPSYPDPAAWGATPRLALIGLIARLETSPEQREPLWFEHD